MLLILQEDYEDGDYDSNGRKLLSTSAAKSVDAVTIAGAEQLPADPAHPVRMRRKHTIKCQKGDACFKPTRLYKMTVHHQRMHAAQQG